jgi:hypothetical protein
MKKTVLIGIGVLILILLISSFSYQLGKQAGLMIGAEQEEEEEEELAPITPTLEESKVIQSQWASARGEVTEIKNRTLTLVANGDSLTVPIREGAELIAMIRKDEGVGSEPKEIEFKEIKVGDRIVVQMELVEGSFEGRGVTVLPVPSK